MWCITTGWSDAYSAVVKCRVVLSRCLLFLLAFSFCCWQAPGRKGDWADMRKSPSVSIQPLLHQDSNGTSTRWLIETGYLAAPGRICWGSLSRLEHQRCSGHGPPACGHALALTNPTPSHGSNSMTEDGGEQPMWRPIGSSRTPRHMAVQHTL
jgi:hypothetical protein